MSIGDAQLHNVANDRLLSEEEGRFRYPTNLASALSPARRWIRAQESGQDVRSLMKATHGRNSLCSRCTSSLPRTLIARHSVFVVRPYLGEVNREHLGRVVIHQVHLLSAVNDHE